MEIWQVKVQIRLINQLMPKTLILITETMCAAFQQKNSGLTNLLPMAAHFESKPVMFSMLQTVGQFRESANEDPYSHLKSFVEVANSIQLLGVSTNALRIKKIFFCHKSGKRLVKCFSSRYHSYKGWFGKKKLLTKFYPPTRNTTMRGESHIQTMGERIGEQSLGAFQGALAQMSIS